LQSDDLKSKSDYHAEVLHQILALIDLTSLGEEDTPGDITTLCNKAQIGSKHVAAVCIYPKFVKLAVELLAGTPVKIATVANFPQGKDALPIVLASIKQSIQNGAHEIDVVFPYQDYLAGQSYAAQDFIGQCKLQCGKNILLKVILETGALLDPQIITDVSRDVIVAGADFIKTSTGKIQVGATLEAAACMLKVIKEMTPKEKRPLGFKASGGVRDIATAEQYLNLAKEIMGAGWISPTTFRFGASQLLDAVRNLPGSV
jgi:deoxyribose-phosphate aldolase